MELVENYDISTYRLQGDCTIFVLHQHMERYTDPDTVTSAWKADTFPLRQYRINNGSAVGIRTLISPLKGTCPRPSRRRRHIMVGDAGFEPTASRAQAARYTKLS